jgi:glucokinase
MILAGDIGGTKTLLGLFRAEKDRPIPVREASFRSPDYPGLEGVIREFLGEETAPVRAASFGIAGPVFGGCSKTTNLPWTVDANQIKREFKIPSVALLNDLEATAYGALHLSDSDFHLLNEGQAVPGGNRAVIAAGTGLGEALLFWDGSRYRPSASEGGHADFAPRGPFEIELLEYLSKRIPHVSYERIVSGPGLLNIFQFMKDTGRAEAPDWLTEKMAVEDPAAVITDAALSGRSEICMHTVDRFVSIYGAEAGNLALKALATGGVYLGGGIAARIVKKLTDGSFMKAFTDKGRYAELLQRIPVRVILNQKAALLGAAHCGLDHLPSER